MPDTPNDDERKRAAMRDIMLSTAFIGGLGVTFEQWDPEGVRLRLPFDPKLTNDGSVYHGGAVAAVVDTAGAAAVWAGHNFDKGARAATVSMTINYTGAAKKSDLIAEARCVRRGRDLSFSEIAVRDDEGKLVATATLVYRIVP
jgi:uncharacterized protein (TIGR00369 family)